MTLLVLDPAKASRRMVEDAEGYGLSEPLERRSPEEVLRGLDGENDLDESLLGCSALIFSGPAEERIVVAFTHEIEVGPWFWAWRGHEPVHAFRPLGSVELHDFHADTPAAHQELRDLIRRARTARRRRYRTCVDCGNRVALEHVVQVNGQTICHGCATAQHGVVF
jgi:hypothetical protein